MRPRWSRIAALVSTLAVVLGMTACSSSGDSDELLIYNAQHESLTKEWIDAFTKETGIKVTYRQGGDTELGNQLIAEGDALARRRLPDRELARDGRGREGRTVRRPERRHSRSGSGAVPSGHRQVDRRRGAQHGVRLQQDQAAARPAAEVDDGSAAARSGRAAGAAPRPRRTSRPSSRPICSSRASRPPRSGWRA